MKLFANILTISKQKMAALAALRQCFIRIDCLITLQYEKKLKKHKRDYILYKYLQIPDKNIELQQNSVNYSHIAI